MALRRNLLVALTATLVAGAATLSGGLPPVATAVASAAPRAGMPAPVMHVGGTPSNPWQDRGYVPRPGHWQDYVLAPKDHNVRPVAVLSADARGGEIQGDPSAALTPGGHPVRLISTGDRTSSPLLTLDFGKEVAGKVRIHVQSASAQRPELHVCFSESKRNMALSPGQNNGETAYAPGCDTANILNGLPGVPYTYDADSHTLPLASAKLPATLTDPQLRGGFRYATVFLDGPGRVDIDSVSLEFTAAPNQKNPSAYPGYFLSSDNELNKIWYAGAYTVQIDTTAADTGKAWPYQQGQQDTSDAQVPGVAPHDEVMFDGGKRDRDVWEGDLSVQAPVTYLSTNDATAVRNSLVALASQQMADGFVPPRSRNVGDTFGDDTFSGEYQTWFVNNMATYYQYTGDKAFLDHWYPAIVKAVGWLESVRQRDPMGLIAFDSGPACGTYGYSDCGHGAYVNALYVRNLSQLAGLATAAGKPADAATYRARADQVANAVNAQLWDANMGAYRLSRETPNVYPQDANATAVLTGVADADQASRALAYLQTHNWSTYGSLMVPPGTPGPIPSHYEPLPSGFEVDARLGTDGQVDTALSLMRTFWGNQLSQDPGSTFWEKMNPDGTPAIAQFTSLAHGWAAEPTTALTTQVLGVRPAGAGFSTYTVQPHPGDLAWAQGSVPTPHGQITVHWTRGGIGAFDLTVHAPTGTTGQVAVPVDVARGWVSLDGHVVWEHGHALRAGVHADASYVYLPGISRGTHYISARTR